jgi:hypothetical protein
MTLLHGEEGVFWVMAAPTLAVLVVLILALLLNELLRGVLWIADRRHR